MIIPVKNKHLVSTKACLLLPACSEHCMGEQTVLSDALFKESFGEFCSTACKVARHTPATGMEPCNASGLSQTAACLGWSGGFSSVGESCIQKLQD